MGEVYVPPLNPDLAKQWMSSLVEKIGMKKLIEPQAIYVESVGMKKNPVCCSSIYTLVAI